MNEKVDTEHQRKREGLGIFFFFFSGWRSFILSNKDNLFFLFS